MSPTPPPDGTVRPAAVVNEEIRALMLRTGGWLTREDRDVYERLRAEWVEAA
ncbi:hypothetical protein ACIQNU_04635 [Streptomyces sp. NPDC091292]|uniref:hypothetical protein n=1 Tax=Streptomyces sp. NPDC091292 TaxID=3365991 RepID=UPI00382D349E